MFRAASKSDSKKNKSNQINFEDIECRALTHPYRRKKHDSERPYLLFKGENIFRQDASKSGSKREKNGSAMPLIGHVLILLIIVHNWKYYLSVKAIWLVD